MTDNDDKHLFSSYHVSGAMLYLDLIFSTILWHSYGDPQFMDELSKIQLGFKPRQPDSKVHVSLYFLRVRKDSIITDKVTIPAWES